MILYKLSPEPGHLYLVRTRLFDPVAMPGLLKVQAGENTTASRQRSWRPGRRHIPAGTSKVSGQVPRRVSYRQLNKGYLGFDDQRIDEISDLAVLHVACGLHVSRPHTHQRFTH